MAYFIPWMEQIRGDLVLTKACLESAIGYPVEIKKVAPLPINIQGKSIDHWVVNSSDVIGGVTQKEKPCFQIEIGPVPINAIKTLIPGNRKRRFLEEVLFPRLLPKHQDWKTIIHTEKKNNKKTAANDNETMLVGINSYIN